MKPLAGGNKLHHSNFLAFLFSGIDVERYPSWNEPIVSPVDGIVVRASDGVLDHQKISLFSTVWIWFHATFLFKPDVTKKEIDIRPNAGNFAMIRTDSGEVVFLAHMKCGSVRVKTGDRVIRGEQIGNVGNSGNTTAPHLHMNAFDQTDDLLISRVIPFTFATYTVITPDGSIEVRDAFPETKQHVHFTD